MAETEGPSDQALADFVRDLALLRDVDFRRASARSALDLRELDALQHKFRQVTEEFREENAASIARIAADFPDSPLFCPVTLYGPIDFGWREVATTRALAWVLDPLTKPAHGFGHVLLRSLLLQLKVIEAEDELVGWRARSEFVAGDCRADLFLEGMVRRPAGAAPAVESRCVVMEAKLGAPPDAAQLKRYHKKWGNAQLFLLTPKGELPKDSPEHCGDLSFLDVATALMRPLHEPTPAAEALRGQPGFGFLRLFIAGLLQDVCGWSLRPHGGCPRVDPVRLKHVLEKLQAAA